MEVAGAVLLVIVVLAPSFKKLISSVAYRNKAAGRAEVIRAKQEGLEAGVRKKKDGKARQGKADG